MTSLPPEISEDVALTVAQTVASLCAPLVRAEDLAALLDVQAVVANAIGEAQRSMVTSTSASTIGRVLLSWEQRLVLMESQNKINGDQIAALRKDIELLKDQVARAGA